MPLQGGSIFCVIKRIDFTKQRREIGDFGAVAICQAYILTGRRRRETDSRIIDILARDHGLLNRLAVNVIPWGMDQTRNVTVEASDERNMVQKGLKS